MAHGGDLAKRFQIAVPFDRFEDTVHFVRRLRVVVGPQEPEALGAVAVHELADGRDGALIGHASS